MHKLLNPDIIRGRRAYPPQSVGHIADITVPRIVWYEYFVSSCFLFQM